MIMIQEINLSCLLYFLLISFIYFKSLQNNLVEKKISYINVVSLNDRDRSTSEEKIMGLNNTENNEQSIPYRNEVIKIFSNMEYAEKINCRNPCMKTHDHSIDDVFLFDFRDRR